MVSFALRESLPTTAITSVQQAEVSADGYSCTIFVAAAGNHLLFFRLSSPSRIEYAGQLQLETSVLLFHLWPSSCVPPGQGVMAVFILRNYMAFTYSFTIQSLDTSTSTECILIQPGKYLKAQRTSCFDLRNTAGRAPQYGVQSAFSPTRLQGYFHLYADTLDCLSFNNSKPKWSRETLATHSIQSMAVANLGPTVDGGAEYLCILSVSTSTDQKVVELTSLVDDFGPVQVSCINSATMLCADTRLPGLTVIGMGEAQFISFLPLQTKQICRWTSCVALPTVSRATCATPVDGTRASLFSTESGEIIILSPQESLSIEVSLLGTAPVAACLSARCLIADGGSYVSISQILGTLGIFLGSADASSGFLTIRPDNSNTVIPYVPLRCQGTSTKDVELFSSLITGRLCPSVCIPGTGTMFDVLMTDDNLLLVASGIFQGGSVRVLGPGSELAPKELISKIHRDEQRLVQLTGDFVGTSPVCTHVHLSGDMLSQSHMLDQVRVSTALFHGWTGAGPTSGSLVWAYGNQLAITGTTRLHCTIDGYIRFASATPGAGLVCVAESGLLFFPSGVQSRDIDMTTLEESGAKWIDCPVAMSLRSLHVSKEGEVIIISCCDSSNGIFYYLIQNGVVTQHRCLSQELSYPAITDAIYLGGYMLIADNQGHVTWMSPHRVTVAVHPGEISFIQVADPLTIIVESQALTETGMRSDFWRIMLRGEGLHVMRIFSPFPIHGLCPRFDKLVALTEDGKVYACSEYQSMNLQQGFLATHGVSRRVVAPANCDYYVVGVITSGAESAQLLKMQSKRGSVAIPVSAAESEGSGSSSQLIEQSFLLLVQKQNLSEYRVEPLYTAEIITSMIQTKLGSSGEEYVVVSTAYGSQGLGQAASDERPAGQGRILVFKPMPDQLVLVTEMELTSSAQDLAPLSYSTGIKEAPMAHLLCAATIQGVFVYSLRGSAQNPMLQQVGHNNFVHGASAICTNGSLVCVAFSCRGLSVYLASAPPATVFDDDTLSLLREKGISVGTKAPITWNCIGICGGLSEGAIRVVTLLSDGSVMFADNSGSISVAISDSISNYIKNGSTHGSATLRVVASHFMGDPVVRLVKRPSNSQSSDALFAVQVGGAVTKIARIPDALATVIAQDSLAADPSQQKVARESCERGGCGSAPHMTPLAGSPSFIALGSSPHELLPPDVSLFLYNQSSIFKCDPLRYLQEGDRQNRVLKRQWLTDVFPVYYNQPTVAKTERQATAKSELRE